MDVIAGNGETGAWCDSGDPYCASGLGLTLHLTYLNRDQDAAASFVLDKIGGRLGPDPPRHGYTLGVVVFCVRG
jgi:cutinase